MAVEVSIPDASQQFEKTPAWRLVKQTVQDEQGEDVTIYWRRKYIVGVGEDARVLRWHEVGSRLRNTKDKAEADTVYTEISGKESTSISKKASILNSCKVYFEDDEFPGTEKQILDRFDVLIVGKGIWGRGCPRCRDYPGPPGASRFWDFKPDGKGKFEPVDSQAMLGEDEEGNPTKGYLNWTPQGDGSIIFTCDRCGTEVRLVK